MFGGPTLHPGYIRLGQLGHRPLGVVESTGAGGGVADLGSPEEAWGACPEVRSLEAALALGAVRD